MKIFLNLIRYEYKMSIKRWGVWVVYAVMLLPYLGSPAIGKEIAEMFGPSQDIWRFSGEFVFRLNTYLPIVAGIVMADRLVRDYKLGVAELIHGAPVSRRVFLAAKYLGALLSGLTPPLVTLLLLVGLFIAYGAPLVLLPMILAAFVVLTVPAYAFITAFSLACPLVLPVRIYQVMFTGYWIWGNFMSPEFFPTLNGTLLTPSGVFALQAFFGGSLSVDEPLVHTPLAAVLNIGVLMSCVVLVLIVVEHYLDWQQRRV